MLDVLRSQGRQEQQVVANDGRVDKMLQARTPEESRRAKGNASEDMSEEVRAILADLLENARNDAAKTERARAEAQYQQVFRTACI